jgi:hypothetical protein
MPKHVGDLYLLLNVFCWVHNLFNVLTVVISMMTHMNMCTYRDFRDVFYKNFVKKDE